MSQPGLLNTRGGGDSPFLLQRLHQLVTALQDGHFPVRWMPDANYGYGYPFYNYYAPLSVYIAAIFKFIGFSYVRAIQLAQLSGFLVAAWGMFCLAKRWWQNEWAGLLAAVAYTVAPFHLVNVYIRGDSLAEFWAMAFYPLLILAANDLLKSLRPGPEWVQTGTQAVAPRELKKKVALLALTYAALILSHNISALIFSPFFLLFILFHMHFQVTLLRPFLAAFLLALALAAWFFGPALAEQPLAQLEPVTQGYFHYSNHFRGSNLVQPSLWFNYDVSGGNAFRMGFVQAITAVISLIFLFMAPKPSLRLKLFICLTTLIATFMITPASQPLWEYLPLLPFTQFPWRFLSIQAFGIALATAALTHLPRPNLLSPSYSALYYGLTSVNSLSTISS